MTEKKVTEAPKEGLRERKRRETQKRIAAAALTLFKERGYNAVTVDQIAEAADVSKRTFFDYFPTKEDVIVSWQDAFGDLLAAKVASRPDNETLAHVVERAMSEAIAESLNPEDVAIDQMVRNTPSLHGHMLRKYATLEQRLAEALAARAPTANSSDDTLVGKPALLAMIAVGVLRLGSQAWDPSSKKTIESYTRNVVGDLWKSIGELGSLEQAERVSQESVD